MKLNVWILLLWSGSCLTVYGQQKSAWAEKLSIKGYAQIRYNRLFETNPDLTCDQCDRSLGNNGGFFLRRGRITLSGHVSDRLYIYIQPDFASNPSSTFQHSLQIRDAYFDLALDEKKEFRFRFGQSKVPFGFENMQSSQNRLALDRNDALNSAVANERDLGVVFYWAPKHIRDRFAYLVSSGLKGSGDYGVFGFGLYNGQTANQAEQNNDLHKVARVTYPLQLENGQIIEASWQAYQGNYTIGVSAGHDLTQRTFVDERMAGTLVVYPQPLGFQAEYNVGSGPQFDPEKMTTTQQPLQGGYAQIMYRLKYPSGEIIPFVKYQAYDGGKKFEVDARSYRVRDLEIGVEFQVRSYFELVALYMISDRTYEDFRRPDNRQKGQTLRLQAQFNF
ncbi:MAG: porin [Spirosomataceae bacterium]